MFRAAFVEHRLPLAGVDRIYSIPEISMVGQNEAQLTENKIPYEVGIARFEELAKGAQGLTRRCF